MRVRRDERKAIKEEYKSGDKVSLELKPREIRILNFDKGAKDWSVLKALQTRNEGPKPPPPPKSIGAHAILGVWEYKLGKIVWTRQFSKDGICTLRRNGKHHWKKSLSPW